MLVLYINVCGVSKDTSAINLFRSYLSNRQQAVIYCNRSSTFLKINCGVPQGSILVPVLFIIYTHVFYKKLQHCSSHFYADDAQLYYRSCQHVNEDLKSLIAISNNFCLSLNSAKSVALLFGKQMARKRCLRLMNLKIDDNIINIDNSAKNL